MVLSLLNFTRQDVLTLLGLRQYTDSIVFEFIDILIMSLAIGYIFSDFIKRPVAQNYDPIKSFKVDKWLNIKHAVYAAAPAVVIHELAHKFTAIAFGAKAILFAPYGFYLLVIVLKAVGFPFLFFVGGFVVHSPLPRIPDALVSLAGPLSNFLIWFIIRMMIKANLGKKYYSILIPLARISLFLAVFNMLPLPGFDGFNFFEALLRKV